MKTLVYKSANGVTPEVRAEVKVDIFATNDELATEGFDTKFTNMEIVRDDNAIIAGLGFQEMDFDWQTMKKVAQDLNLSLTVIDINEDDATEIVTATTPSQ